MVGGWDGEHRQAVGPEEFPEKFGHYEKEPWQRERRGALTKTVSLFHWPRVFRQPYYSVIFTLTPIPKASGPTWLLTLQVNGS